MERVAVDGNIEPGMMIVPAEMLAEERAEIEFFQALPHCGHIDLHGLPFIPAFAIPVNR